MKSVSKIPNEARCRELAEELILGKDLLCPHCQKELQRGHKEYLWCKYCRRKIRPKSLTFLKRSKLSYREVLILLICWQRNMTPGSIREFSDISYTTIARWYVRFRQLLPRDKGLLSGIVEADEAFFGKRKYGGQTIIMGVIERDSRKLRLSIIPDREQDSLEEFLVKNVSRESFINTDAWSGYSGLEWYGYGHFMHNHSIGQFKGTNLIENVWSVIKRAMRRMYGCISTKKINELIVEWEARWNFKELFDCPLNYLKYVFVPF
jgi:hypothetical protein